MVSHLSPGIEFPQRAPAWIEDRGWVDVLGTKRRFARGEPKQTRAVASRDRVGVHFDGLTIEGP